MSSSRNHTLRMYRPGETRYHCGARNCLNQATHRCEYDYTSGSSGRKAHAVVDRCRGHAQQFRETHGATYIFNDRENDNETA